MGNCVEERGASALIAMIMDHPSNSGRDLHTQRSLSQALSRKNLECLRNIFDDIKRGIFLPDNFQ